MHSPNSCGSRYAPEQYLWVNCLRKNGKNVDFEHRADVRPHNIEATERYAVSNFIYLDWRQFNLTPPKHLRSFAKNDFHDSITHIEWQRLYRQYLDNSLVVPEKDPMRDLLNRKAKYIKRCHNIAKACSAFLFFDKRPRRKIREKILHFLTRNVQLK
jgi:hypothetical protein